MSSIRALAISSSFAQLKHKPKRVSSPGMLRVQIPSGTNRVWVDEVECRDTKPLYPGDPVTSYCRATDSAGHTLSFPANMIRKYRVEEPTWPLNKLVGAGIAGLFVGYLIHRAGCPAHG